MLNFLRYFWRLYNKLRRYFKVWYRSLLKSSFKYFDLKKDQNDLKINLGAGQWWLRHWYNLDAPFGVRSYKKNFIDYPFDLCSQDKLPFSDGTVRMFYSSHCIEHIPQKYLEHVFNECCRSMKLEGVIRLTTPDFDKACDAFEQQDEEFFIRTCSRTGTGEYTYTTDDFSIEQKFICYFAGTLSEQISDVEVAKLYKEMGRYKFADKILENLELNKIGATAGEVGYHSNWFSFEKLKSMLEGAGFSDVRRCSRSGSRFEEMRKPKSYFDQSYPKISLYVEARKL
jgi:predicted SAM-dependent methyltransferase